MEEEDKFRIANMLNYQIGQLPIKYLGIPLSSNKLYAGDFVGLPKKIYKRIPLWKGKHSSGRRRLILTNSCLSSLPTYMMGFYLLPQDTHRKMDHVRSRFF
jgi:hypothetical protein